MQRRAAAAYFVLFMVISAGAYAYIGMAERPNVDVSGETRAVGDSFTVGERTYTVNAIGQSGASTVGNVTWTNEQAAYSAALSNNSTVSWQAVSWEGQRVESRTLENGTTLQYNGSAHQVLLNGSASPPTVRLVKVSNTSINETFEQGGTISLRLDGELVLGATITEITAQQATLSNGDPYLVSIANETDPDSAELRQQYNVTRRLSVDPAVYNQTVTIEGVEYVTFRANDTNRRLDTYLAEPEVKTLAEGETLQYEGNETTIGNITRGEVPLTWSGSKTFLVELSEGSTVDLNNQSYLVHFPDTSSVQLLPNTTDNYEDYQSDQAEIENYEERKAGLWGVTILSFLAGLILLGAAYLPVKD